MTSKAIKIALTCVVLVAALGGLMYTTLSEGTEYYIHVDEVMQNPAAWQGQAAAAARIRRAICGSAPTRWTTSSSVQLQRQGHHGELHRRRPRHVQERVGSRAQRASCTATASAVEPNGVMAKCPSKYNAADAAGNGGQLDVRPRLVHPARHVRRRQLRARRVASPAAAAVRAPSSRAASAPST